MRIDRLEVRNFRGFEARTFHFARPEAAPEGQGSFHLVIGQNGRGKTSTLEALAVAGGSWLLGIPGTKTRHIDKKDIRIKVIDYEDTARIAPQTPVEVEAWGKIMGRELSWKRELRSETGRTTWVRAQNVKRLAQESVDRVLAGERLNLPLISYYGAGRLWLSDAPTVSASKPDDDLAERFSSHLAGYRLSVDSTCSPHDLLRWLKFEQQLAVQEGKESTQFRVVKEAIRQAVDGCQRVHYHLRLGLLLDIDDQPRLPFGNLSDGQRNMVAMIGDIAYKAAQLNPHLGDAVLRQTPGLVLIDEIDLHLHPRWQRHVVEDLRRIFPELQFVATTHSPFIVQTAREGEIVKLEGDLALEPAGRTLEEVARLVMDITNLERSPRHQEMLDTARRYLDMVDEAQTANAERQREIQEEFIRMLAPFSDNPAYTALLERKGLLKKVPSDAAG